MNKILKLKYSTQMHSIFNNNKHVFKTDATKVQFILDTEPIVSSYIDYFNIWLKSY